MTTPRSAGDKALFDFSQETLNCPLCLRFWTHNDREWNHNPNMQKAVNTLTEKHNF